MNSWRKYQDVLSFRSSKPSLMKKLLVKVKQVSNKCAENLQFLLPEHSTVPPKYQLTNSCQKQGWETLKFPEGAAEVKLSNSSYNYGANKHSLPRLFQLSMLTSDKTVLL